MEWYDYPIVGDFRQQFDWASYPVNGEDIEVPFNTPVTALFPGTISKQYYDAGGGQVIIRADNAQDLRGIPYYWFAHLDQIQVTQGQHVDAGTQIGLSGGQNVGGVHPSAPNYSSGPHLEFGEAKSNEIPYTLATITPDLNPNWILDWAKGARIPHKEIASSTGNTLLTSQANSPKCTCDAGYHIILSGLGDSVCRNDSFPFDTRPCKENQTTDPLTQISNFFNTISPWLSDPVRIIKVLFGILLIGIAVFLLVNPGSGIATVIKSGARKAGLR